MRRKPGQQPSGTAKPRSRAVLVKMGEELRNEIEVLAVTRKKTVQELGIEAFCDLLRKHGRPVDLIDAFRKSAANEKSDEARPKAATGKSRQKRR